MSDSYNTIFIVDFLKYITKSVLSVAVGGILLVI